MPKLILGIHIIIGFLLCMYMIGVCTFTYIRRLQHLTTKYRFPRCWEFLNDKLYNIHHDTYSLDKQKEFYYNSIVASLIIAFVGGLWWPIIFYSCILSKKLILLIYNRVIKNLLYSICISKEERMQIALGTNNTVEEPKG